MLLRMVTPPGSMAMHLTHPELWTRLQTFMRKAGTQLNTENLSTCCREHVF